jgi:hypothetical protein
LHVGWGHVPCQISHFLLLLNRFAHQARFCSFAHLSNNNVQSTAAPHHTSMVWWGGTGGRDTQRPKRLSNRTAQLPIVFALVETQSKQSYDTQLWTVQFGRSVGLFAMTAVATRKNIHDERILPVAPRIRGAYLAPARQTGSESQTHKYLYTAGNTGAPGPTTIHTHSIHIFIRFIWRISYCTACRT